MHAARLATEKADFRPALPMCSQPGISEMQMTKKLTYAEQLKHPNWQRKRLEMLNAADFQCTRCGDKEKTLHVHHKQYVKGRMAWEYEQDELDVLCETCHELSHHVKEKLATLLDCSFSDISGESAAFGFFSGFLLPFRLAGEDAALEGWRVCRPFFDLGFMMAALGPEDMKDALRRKVADGRIPADDPRVRLVLSDDEQE